MSGAVTTWTDVAKLRTVRGSSMKCTEIEPQRDGTGFVEVRHKDDNGETVINRSYFSTTEARLVAQAMLDCADEIDAKRGGQP
jgi:hypothetical protein